jgi:histidyl-tRNA synthetase
MEELDLFPAQIQKGTDALFFNLGEKESDAAFDCMQSLRSTGISCELYHESAKMDKQFKYAEKKNIRYAIIIGSRELESAQAVIKDLSTGKQETIPLKDLSAFFKNGN